MRALSCKEAICTRWLLAVLWVAISLEPSHSQTCEPSQSDKLIASDGAIFDYFGDDVAVSGDLAVAGAHWDDDNGANSGSAYVFRFDGSRWVEEAKLLAEGGAADDQFGSSVAIVGDTIAVGAPLRNDAGSNSGTVYIFRSTGTTWIQEAKLVASDGASGDFFGNSVAISDDIVAVGARHADDKGSNSGAVYIFRFNGESWAEESKLLASDGTSFDQFGWAVACTDNLVTVGTPWTSNNLTGNNRGSCYVFQFSDATWSEQTTLYGDEEPDGAQFGSAVSLSGNTVIVGAIWDDTNGMNSGAAYVYTYDGAAWSRQTKLTASDGTAGDEFGGAVAISGDVVVVGARKDGDLGERSGSAYVYRFDGLGWAEEAKLLANDGEADDEFGRSVSLSFDAVFVGASRTDDNGTNSGSAYTFYLNCSEPCLPDVNGDGLLTPTDFTAWINAHNNMLPQCDQNGDGLCDPADFSAWLLNFSDGC